MSRHRLGVHGYTHNGLFHSEDILMRDLLKALYMAKETLTPVMLEQGYRTCLVFSNGAVFHTAREYVSGQGFREYWKRDVIVLCKYAYGGYPLYYIDEVNNVLCRDCAKCEVEKEPEEVYLKDLPVYCDVNWEDDSLYCDDCNERIESAYAESAYAERDNVQEQ